MIVCFSTLSAIIPRLGYHLDCVTGALFKARAAARAFFILELVAQARPQLGNGVLGTGRVTIVAFEAVAAGIAALRFIARFLLDEPGDDLDESVQSFGKRERARSIRIGIAID